MTNPPEADESELKYEVTKVLESLRSVKINELNALSCIKSTVFHNFSHFSHFSHCTLLTLYDFWDNEGPGLCLGRIGQRTFAVDVSLFLILAKGIRQ